MKTANLAELTHSQLHISFLHNDVALFVATVIRRVSFHHLLVVKDHRVLPFGDLACEVPLRAHIVASAVDQNARAVGVVVAGAEIGTVGTATRSRRW